MAALLKLEGVRAGYGLIEVLKGISLEVHEGEIVTLIGANGAGKTTTLMCVSGAVRVRCVDGGRVLEAPSPVAAARRGPPPRLITESSAPG